MRFHNFATGALAILLSILVFGVPAKAGKITLFDVPDTTSSYPVAINSNGTIAGDCDTGGFIRNADGTFTTFTVPGALFVNVGGMNDDGQVAGWYLVTNTGPYYGFLREPAGKIKTFDISGAEALTVTGINNYGIIVGTYDEANFVRHGFLRDSKGKITSFDAPNTDDTEPESLSDGGEVTGGSISHDGIIYGFVRATDGTVTDFRGPDDSTFTWGLDINRVGAATGYYQDTAGLQHGFLRTADGTIATIDPPGTEFSRPWAINNKGAVVGDTRIEGNIDRGFVRNPNGKFRVFKVRQYPNIITSAINDAGTVTGIVVADKHQHSFFRTK